MLFLIGFLGKTTNLNGGINLDDLLFHGEVQNAAEQKTDIADCLGCQALFFLFQKQVLDFCSGDLVDGPMSPFWKKMAIEDKFITFPGILL